MRKGVLDGKSWFGNIRDMKAFVAFAGLLVAMGANAQFGDSMLDMQYGPFALLQRQDLRKELRLTKDQSKQMDEIGKNLTKASETGGLQLSGMQKVDDDMLAVLENGQKQRFSELRIQIRGATSLSDPAVAKALELTDDQRVAVKRIRQTAQNQLLDAIRKGSRDSTLMEKISKLEEKELLLVLSGDQQKAFMKMAGVIYKGARLKGQWHLSRKGHNRGPQ